jgi:hypothetical protein
MGDPGAEAQRQALTNTSQELGHADADRTTHPHHQALCTACPRFWPFRGPVPLFP